MDDKLKVPQKNKSLLTSPQELANKLRVLIGQRFELTGKSRTDGSEVRKLVGATLLADNPPQDAPENSFEIVPPKGVPRILLEYIDTYIVTGDNSYNLQVWNRNPSSESVQVHYSNGDTLQTNEVRFVLVKIDPRQQIIISVAILTPKYIVRQFGAFGKPTVKNQLIISSSARQSVLARPNSLLFYDDESDLGEASNIDNLSEFSIHDAPIEKTLLPLSKIKDIVIDTIIGQPIAPGATKNRGQLLEEKFATALGYSIGEEELLAGGYPDIRNQALEVKIQDSPTVDLGKFSPEFKEAPPKCSGFTTRNMRYLIALTNPETNVIEGAILCPGSKLGLHFTYVPEESYKCQRSIPVNFFESIKGQSIFNP